MAKYYGMIGFGVMQETSPGVWRDRIVSYPYYGDVLSNTRQLERGEKLNDNIDVNNSFSIVADAFAYEHFFNMRYIEWLGSKWKVTSVKVERPRLILTVSGLYNPKGT